MKNILRAWRGRCHGWGLRVRERGAERDEIADEPERRTVRIGQGNNVETKRAADLRMELIAAEAELAKDAMSKGAAGGKKSNCATRGGSAGSIGAPASSQRSRVW